MENHNAATTRAPLEGTDRSFWLETSYAIFPTRFGWQLFVKPVGPWSTNRTLRSIDRLRSQVGKLRAAGFRRVIR